jgi:phage baseplate assembly protein W
MSVPHFALPFRIVGTSAVTNEQDSLDDVAACVAAIERYHPGDRVEAPDFGVPDQTFGVAIDQRAITDAIERYEPRSVPSVADQLDALDEGIRHVQIETHGGQTT